MPGTERPDTQQPGPGARGSEQRGLFGFCRAGFESELAAELTERAACAGIAGYARAEHGQAFARFLAHEAYDALPWASLIFARQTLDLIAELSGLTAGDRIGPILGALEPRGERFSELQVAHPDGDAGRPLSGLARSLANALRPALRKAGLLVDQKSNKARELHVVLLDGGHLLLAARDPSRGPSWPGGIPRLRMLSDAPSRSALKLEEALLVLLDERERSAWMQPGQRAADLGAAPGGWSWVLARAHLRVTAIDNGPLAASALATGLIEHQRADGFSYQPPKPVDWMVCDMVEQPVRVAARVSTWLREGWCRQTIFNLKLPMKKRWQEVCRCLDLLRQQAGGPLELRAKQLYHDREEITVFARRSAGH